MTTTLDIIAPPARRPSRLAAIVTLPRCFALLASLAAGLQLLSLPHISGVHALRWGAASLSLLYLLTGLLVLSGQARSRSWFWIQLVLFSAQATLFWLAILNSPEPFPWQGLLVATVVSQGAAIGLVLLGGTRLVAPAKALLFCFSTALALVSAEILLEVVPPGGEGTGELVIWEGPALADPILGHRYKPNSVRRTIYPSNPREYFRIIKQFDAIPPKMFALLEHEGARAEIQFPPGDPPRLRLHPLELNDGPSWCIQLSHDGYAVKAGEKYRVRFRARADAPRPVAVVFGRGVPPWDGLGLLAKFQIIPQWQQFERDFLLTDNARNARLYFDLGSSDAAIELADISITPLSATIPNPVKYGVEYEMNSWGVRGPDYEIPRPADVFRIVCLGDSFTFGQGVHEEDTFTARLESLLNENASNSSRRVKYEVVNCGVCGYNTRQERLQFEHYASQYEPNLVIVTMVWNDNLGADEATPQGNTQLLRLLGTTKQALQSEIDYSPCVTELRALHQTCQDRGIPLAVSVFRTAKKNDWQLLIDTVTQGLQGTSIPVMDMGTALLSGHSWEELIVHPVDYHPNELAHRLVAEELFRILSARGLFAAP